MFGASKDHGADSAAWTLAMHIECSRARGCDTSALSLDIYKCFDQLSRESIVSLARAAGAPECVVQPWFRMLSSLVVMNGIGTGVGVGYQRPTSIPQGCPLS
eukprot:5026238-Alexandrium_andersonii.AAC.1